MQVQKIQNNNYNPNFNAKLQLQGCYDDVSHKTIKYWTQKASKIGKKSDVIEMFITDPFNYKTIYNKYYEPAGRDYSKIDRTVIGGMKNKSNHGITYDIKNYCVPKSENTHKEMTNKIVCSFLDSLKKKLK